MWCLWLRFWLRFCWGRVSLWSPSCPLLHCMQEDGLELPALLDNLPIADIKSMFLLLAQCTFSMYVYIVEWLHQAINISTALKVFMVRNSSLCFHSTVKPNFPKALIQPKSALKSDASKSWMGWQHKSVIPIMENGANNFISLPDRL